MTKYRIQNVNGSWWTGSCWGVQECAEEYTRGELSDLDIDSDVNTETHYDNSSDDIGWSSEDGWIDASAYKVKGI